MHNTNKDQMKIGLLLASPKTQRIPTTLAAIKIQEAKKIKMVLAIAKILTVTKLTKKAKKIKLQQLWETPWWKTLFMGQLIGTAKTVDL